MPALPSVGGSNNTWGQELNDYLTDVQSRVPDTDYTSTAPASPTAGLKWFARFRARRIPSFVGPTGQDSQVQPAMFSNKVVQVTAINNSTTPSITGGAFTHLNNATATPTAVSNASTNLFASIVRYRVATTTTAGTGCGTRSNTAQWFLSPTANMGGFFLVIRFGISAVTATNRLFIGMSSSTAVLSPTVEPSTFLNCIGFASDSTQTNFRFVSNDGTGSVTAVDLGTNFPTNSAATNFYEFRLFSASGSGQSVYWSATRINDGVTVQGGPVTADLPANGTLLACHVHHSNGTTAAAASLDVQSMYIESDN